MVTKRKQLLNYVDKKEKIMLTNCNNYVKLCNVNEFNGWPTVLNGQEEEVTDNERGKAGPESWIQDCRKTQPLRRNGTVKALFVLSGWSR